MLFSFGQLKCRFATTGLFSMSVSTLESENAQPVAQTQNSELIYRLEDRPPLPQTLFAACQHLLAMFVAVITPEIGRAHV